ncbi:restriction endonuclease subunit S [Candidatus Bipolaricaulota bacterium]|nr:restriction endonuclease subunit S [Candidatus Bipolaricaulota bacterium]
MPEHPIATQEAESLPPGYRMTELGPLPEEWRVVRLGEVVELRKGTVLPTEVPEARYLGLEHIDSGEIRIQRFGKASDTQSAKAVFHSGDILYGKLRPYLDKAALAEWDGVCSTDILVLIVKEIVDRIFAAYLMHTDFVLDHAIATTTGVNHPRTSWKSLSQAIIPLPPLAEQRAIAYVLRTVQEAKEATERVIAALKELKKSLMRHLFTYGPVPLDKTDAVPMQETELGPIPAHWRVVRLGEVVAAGILLIRNGFPQGKHSLSGQGVPHLRPFNVTNDGYIDLEQVKYVPPPPDESPYWLKKGDIIFNNTNSEELVGKTAYFALDGQYVLSNHMTIIRVLKADVLNGYWLAKYLHYLWMQGVFRRLCRRHVNQASVSLERLKGLELPLPPLAEQQEIARILQAVDKRIEAEEKKKTALETLFKTLLQHLMTAKVRVKDFQCKEVGGD